MDRVTRPQDGDQDDIAIVDMGAYEFWSIDLSDTITLDLPSKWSMVSLPVNPKDKRINTVFPEARDWIPTGACIRASISWQGILDTPKQCSRWDNDFCGGCRLSGHGNLE